MLSWEGSAPCLGWDADRGWRSMNATDLKEGVTELIPKSFLSIAIILAIFVLEQSTAWSRSALQQEKARLTLPSHEIVF